ncbi:hypothetical protein [Kinneretia aquatilis]|uniref:hypothetical protein n=1 Tax=Kinneretia aquatilis TaxID=2070761 RepID=UPI0014953734|nr:hypothetical protein [Paucibacter aquatile]WIV99495.1 hypothetical protein K9V56_008445 [Paucibacter aquatile]
MHRDSVSPAGTARSQPDILAIDADGNTYVIEDQDGLKLVPIVTSARDRDPFSTGSEGVVQVTGQVYNAASDVAGQPLEFKVSGPAVNYNNGQSAGVIEGSSKLVFVTMDGTINAWRSGTNPDMLEAVVVKDYSLIQPADRGASPPMTAMAACCGISPSTACSTPLGAWRLRRRVLAPMPAPMPAPCWRPIFGDGTIAGYG